jgi:hypothetical protein
MLASNQSLHDAVLHYTRPKTEALIRKGIDLSTPWYKPEGYALL